MKEEILRKLPSVDELINTPKVKQLSAEYNREIVVDVVREELNDLRKKILDNATHLLDEDSRSLENISTTIISRLQKKTTPSLRRAVNATGIILHTVFWVKIPTQESGYMIKP